MYVQVSSISPDRILLLDTYFNVVVFHGETVAEWKRQNYQDNPEYASFKQLLEAPQEEAKELMRERFPYPRFVDCNQHGSQVICVCVVVRAGFFWGGGCLVSCDVIVEVQGVLTEFACMCCPLVSLDTYAGTHKRTHALSLCLSHAHSSSLCAHIR